MRNKILANNYGIGLIHVMIVSTLMILGALVASEVFMTTVKVAQQATTTNELHLIRERIFKRLDCGASLASRQPPLPADPNSPSALAQCAMEITDVFRGPQLVMKDRLTHQNLFATVDSEQEVSTEASWNIRAGCFLKAIPSGKQFCVLVQRQHALDPQNPNAGFVSNWHRLFEFPLCCDGTDGLSLGPGL